jgi:hypothetical protein
MRNNPDFLYASNNKTMPSNQTPISAHKVDIERQYGLLHRFIRANIRELHKVSQQHLASAKDLEDSTRNLPRSGELSVDDDFPAYASFIPSGVTETKARIIYLRLRASKISSLIDASEIIEKRVHKKLV